RDTCPDQYRHARDHHPVDASGREESLNRDATVYIRMFETAAFELPYDFVWFPERLLDKPAFDRREVKRTAAQYNHWLVAVKPQVSELPHDLEGPAADHDYIDAGEEFVEPVRHLLTCV